MKLNILLFILVVETSCQPIDGENAKTPQFGERLSVRKEQNDGGNPSEQNSNKDIRSKRGHNVSNTRHFEIGGHSLYGIDNKGSVYSSGNTHGLAIPVVGPSSNHGFTIPVLGPTSSQASSGPLITYGSAKLTRTGSRRHQPLESSHRKLVSPGLNQHSAPHVGIKDSETIKKSHGHKKNGPYSDHYGYAPGKGYYYGK